jgi:hypothetical protein
VSGPCVPGSADNANDNVNIKNIRSCVYSIPYIPVYYFWPYYTCLGQPSV